MAKMCFLIPGLSFWSLWCIIQRVLDDFLAINGYIRHPMHVSDSLDSKWPFLNVVTNVVQHLHFYKAALLLKLHGRYCFNFKLAYKLLIIYLQVSVSLNTLKESLLFNYQRVFFFTERCHFLEAASKMKVQRLPL